VIVDWEIVSSFSRFKLTTPLPLCVPT